MGARQRSQGGIPLLHAAVAAGATISTLNGFLALRDARVLNGAEVRDLRRKKIELSVENL